MVSGANIIMNKFLLCIPILLVFVSVVMSAGSGEQNLAAHGLEETPPQSSVHRQGSPQTIQQLLMVKKEQRFEPKPVSENTVLSKTSSLIPIPLSTNAYPKHEKLSLVLGEFNSTMPLNNQQQNQRSSADYWGDKVQRLFQNKKFKHAILSNFLNGTTKKWLSTGNELWDGLISDCMVKPTFSCLQKNVYGYLDKTLLLDDVNVTNSFLFIRNQVNYTDQLIRSNEIDDDLAAADASSNEINDPETRRSFTEDDTPATPIEEVTNALYGKSVRFAMTHDVQLKMPKMLFDGAILRISPQSFEGNGALVKIELEPDTTDVQQSHGTGRLLFKKIKKMFKNKLLLGFLAIVLVIKIIKIKMMWLLPIIVGVSTAKKMILKFLLFVFPALSHIFKLCSWYHHNYHHTKFHHHQHAINHLHTVVPPWYESHHSAHDTPTLIYTKPPTGHPADYLHSGPSHLHQHHQPDWEFSGPGLGSEYIGDIHRNAQVGGFEPKFDDLKDMKMWGLLPTNPPPTTSHSINTNPLTQSTQSKILHNSLAIKSPNAARIVAQYAHPNQLDPRQNNQQVNVATVDPFYGPIIAKIDSIFGQLGVQDEPCKERLLCSMYKNPVRYSPHSNFISAELSRDANELKKPMNTNIAVMRFYRYIQAARDGQEQKDCLAFYPQCSINTEHKR